MSSTSVGNIQPSDSVTITIDLQPPVDAQIGVYRGSMYLNYKKLYKIIFPLFFSKGKQKLSVSFERQDMKNPIFCCNFATRIKPKRQGLKIRDNFESS